MFFQDEAGPAAKGATEAAPDGAEGPQPGSTPRRHKDWYPGPEAGVRTRSTCETDPGGEDSALG